MADDWRVTVTLDDEGGIPLMEALRELRLEGAIRDRLEGRVSVSGGDGSLLSPDRTIFLYADREGAARVAAGVVADVLRREDVRADIVLDHWHPIEEQWEPASVPLPSTDEEREAERRRLIEQETEESLESGVPRWEVRLEVEDHRTARELADRLEADGVPVARHWRYLLVGAVNRDEAEALAERLRAEAPAGARIAVEPSGGAVWEVLPANPFAVFGGLGV
jgi:hypothetical protein